MGQRHLRLVEVYEALIERTSKLLHEDCPRFRPVAGAYSPYGALFGFSSQLLEHMALKTLAPDAVTKFGLEDVFAEGDADKLAWVSGWRKLPHVPRDVLKLFEYPQPFAEEVFGRVEQALRRRVAGGGATAAARAGRLLVSAEDQLPVDSHAASIPELPAHYVLSSDAALVAAHRAEPCEETQLLHRRVEGELVVSYRTDGGWVAISKDILTEICGAGRDARIVGLPREAAAVLKLMCPHFVIEPPPAPS
jgi:hypothetical protein